MHKQRSFPLRITDEDQRRARHLAEKTGLSENRLYSDLHEGLLVREQMAYFEKLRDLRVAAEEAIALLDLAPDVVPSAEDALPRAQGRRRREANLSRS